MRPTCESCVFLYEEKRVKKCFWKHRLYPKKCRDYVKRR